MLPHRSASLWLLLALALPACEMETANDLYMKGLEVEGAAERGPCRLAYDEEAKAQTLNSGRVRDCLVQQQKALELYERAAERGEIGRDFKNRLEDARLRVQKLESMLRMVKQMETDQTLRQVGGRS